MMDCRDYGAMLSYVARGQYLYIRSGGSIHNEWGFGNDMVRYLFSPFRRIMTGKD